MSRLTIDRAKYISKGIDYGLYRKYYFKPEIGNDRFYGGAYVRGSTSTYTSTENSGSTSSDITPDGVRIIKHRQLSTGLSLGHKWVGPKNIVFDLSAGLGRKLFERNDIQAGTVNPDKIPTSSLDWFLRFYMGYRLGGK